MGTTDQPLSGESAAGGRDDHNSDNDSSHQFSFKSDRKSPTACEPGLCNPREPAAFV
jgi:hypothetical protein